MSLSLFLLGSDNRVEGTGGGVCVLCVEKVDLIACDSRREPPFSRRAWRAISPSLIPAWGVIMGGLSPQKPQWSIHATLKMFIFSFQYKDYLNSSLCFRDIFYFWVCKVFYIWINHTDNLLWLLLHCSPGGAPRAEHVCFVLQRDDATRRSQEVIWICKHKWVNAARARHDFTVSFCHVRQHWEVFKGFTDLTLSKTS